MRVRVTHGDWVDGERLGVVGVVTDVHREQVVVIVEGGSDWKEQPDGGVSLRVQRQCRRLVPRRHVVAVQQTVVLDVETVVPPSAGHLEQLNQGHA